MNHSIFSIRLVAVVMMAVVVISSCSKEGDTGPQGPSGPQGPAGSVNMISSDWKSITFTGGSPWTGELSAPELTQEILDKGVIKLYFNANSYVLEVPSEYVSGMTFLSQVGNIHIAAPQRWDATSGYSYRYVLIPGS
jgi:hypothetical protein